MENPNLYQQKALRLSGYQFMIMLKKVRGLTTRTKRGYSYHFLKLKDLKTVVCSGCRIHLDWMIGHGRCHILSKSSVFVNTQDRYTSD